MLKIAGLPDKLASSKNNGSKSASSRNNNSRPASKRNDGNNKVDGFSIDGNSVEHAKKSKKLSKSENLSKSQKLSKTRKLFKFQKLAKSRKKLSKSGNLFNFDAKKNGPSFLTSNARTAFNYLRLALIKALIL